MLTGKSRCLCHPPVLPPLLRFCHKHQPPSLLHYSISGRLQAWSGLNCGRSAPFDCPISTDSGKKKEGSTRNVREGSMAKWGCHVVDASHVPLFHFHLFFFFPCCFCLPTTCSTVSRYLRINLGAWRPWRPWRPWHRLAPPFRCCGWAPVTWRWTQAWHLTWQQQPAKLPCRPGLRPSLRPTHNECHALLVVYARSVSSVGGNSNQACLPSCGTRICGLVD